MFMASQYRKLTVEICCEQIVSQFYHRGRDGRAGMASIVLRPGIQTLNWKKLAEHIAAQLPSYARPLWIRVQSEMGVTSTMKHSKVSVTQL